MKPRRVCIAVWVLFGLTSASYAEYNTPKNDLAVPPLQLLDYSLGLKSEKDASLAPVDPTGLAPLRRESNKPFIGLSLTKPLSK